MENISDLASIGALSVLPPVIAIVLAIWTRQVFLSLACGIWLGYVILAYKKFWVEDLEAKLSAAQSQDPATTLSSVAAETSFSIINALRSLLQGTFDAINGIVNVFATSSYQTQIIIFTLVMGGLIALVQRSGGVQGFVNRILKWLDKETGKAADRGQRKKVELLAFMTGMVLFIESNISILTVGTLYRPVFDKLKIPREKLAYIADSSSAPSCILLPLNAWGAYLIVEMKDNGVDGGFPALFNAIAYNFYPMLVIVIMLFVILSGRDIGEMKTAELRAEKTGKLLRDGAKPMVADDTLNMAVIEGAKPKARNMIIPIALLVALVPTFLIMTGWGTAKEILAEQILANPDLPNKVDPFLALREGSGGTSILYASSFACFIAMLMYKFSGTMGVRESFETVMKGMGSMLPLAILMILAFAIGDVCGEDFLNTGNYVAETTRDIISPALVPAMIFLISCFIAFSTGTSWGTFAIMLGIAIPLATAMDTNISLAIAAVLGGGIFGDHCSPTSDTSVISSMASASDHIDHIRTQLPYALIGGTITVILYLILGFLGV